MTDQLQLLCEVAEGLRYLYSFNILHGDITRLNILINDQGKALLGDWPVDGAIRCADALLYKPLQGDNEDDRVPSFTTMSDIYSFGSITLEVAYHITMSARTPKLSSSCITARTAAACAVLHH
ncbi:hypothetical protein EV421DRAFT_1929741 [Armillaria borealis]|uniref:Protein kinase domain-containing protein n=1 Tax=Armillaria borealis TaxID=47425 RepID=A0AA39MEU7_9AGAR|nr:hypothetical protein EV421DRAFT_1929741 [Armillaria borealis]